MHRLSLDLDDFYRRIRLRDYFFNHPSSHEQETSALSTTNLRRPSNWRPPKSSISPAVEAFINSFHSGVRRSLRAGNRETPDNLSPEERRALISLRDRKDIVIKPADKGSAVVIWAKEEYEREALRQLSDMSRYELLTQDPTAANNSTISKTVGELLVNGSINAPTAKDLTEKEPRTASFYLLPKIHKSLTSPPGRPIVSSNGCPTERISAFVDTKLKPLVTNIPSFIRDTKHLLSEISALPPFPPHALQVTMDVVGLYNNIPHEDGMDACRKFLDQRSACEPPTAEIVKLIDLVLNLNCFTFNGKHYRQILGTAMGTRMAPSYANLFMAVVEDKILTTAPGGLTPEFYKRFIDDLLMVWLHGEASLLRFLDHANSLHPSIQFTMEYGQSVHFLDALLALERNGRISSDLYVKPTDSHQYLLPSSNHPPHVHVHLPYGLALRIRQIVSSDERLHVRLQELKSFLLERGYSGPDVDQQFTKAVRVPRLVALQAKKKVSGDRVPLVCEWNERLPNLGGLIQQFLPVLQSDENLSTCFSAPPLLSYRRPRNLRDLLVHTTCKNPDHRVHSAAGSYKCEHARCMTCATIVNLTRIELKSESRPIHGHFTCETRALVYLITCSSCNAVYVGKTGQKLRERLNGHRADIRNGNDTPVGVHFGQPGHELRVSGLELTSKNATSRKVRERSWIDFFKQTEVFSCMNRDDGIDFLTL